MRTGEAELLRAKLASVEEEIRVLKAEVALLAAKPKRFSDLEGIWQGKAEFSFEEIQAEEFKLKEAL